MAASSWTYRSAAEMADALDAKQVSAVELAEAAIARIEACEPRLNAVCVRTFGTALEAAKQADARRARGESGPLLGVPMTIKESFNLAGTPTTWGFPEARDFKPADDALAVQRVKAAGAVIFAKTNVPIALGDWQSYNEIYGVTNNPFDLARSPGGSSGGSSAALAAGYGALSLGSDIGGSLRVPAHFCGIFAHKPTFDLAPSRGHTPPGLTPLPGSADLAVIGPMARTARDLETLFDAIAGPDELQEGVAYRLALPPPRHERLADYRVLVLNSHPLTPTNSSVASAIGAVLRPGSKRPGVKVARQSELLPDPVGAARLYMRLLLATLAARWPAEAQESLRASAAKLDAADVSLRAERLRGSVMPFREWIFDNGKRLGLRARWRAPVRKIRRGAVSGLANPRLPARSFAGSGRKARDDQRRAATLSRPADLAGRRHASWASRDRAADRPFARKPADRRADHRPLARGPHAAASRATDRARIRRLRAAAGVWLEPPPAFAG